MQTQTKAVKAVITPANKPNWDVVDAMDHVELAILPFRAVEALATNEKIASEDDFPRLKRSDLCALLNVLTSNLEAVTAQARGVAVDCAKGV